jgi:hypothetical protein
LFHDSLFAVRGAGAVIVAGMQRDRHGQREKTENNKAPPDQQPVGVDTFQNYNLLGNVSAMWLGVSQRATNAESG